MNRLLRAIGLATVLTGMLFLMLPLLVLGRGVILFALGFCILVGVLWAWDKR